MAALPLEAEKKTPTLSAVREALAGNLCRCTGYEAIYRAVRSAHAVPGGAFEAGGGAAGQ